MTPQDILGLTSQSEWTGVLLSTIFNEVGIDAAKWFLAEGSDTAVMTRTIPLAKAWDDAMIVYAQNGEAIRPEQGYPIRLLLPRFEGNMNIKWLRRIELSEEPYMTREETSRYTYPEKDKIRMFSFEMDARSIITYQSYPQQINKGYVEIRGFGLEWKREGERGRSEYRWWNKLGNCKTTGAPIEQSPHLFQIFMELEWRFSRDFKQVTDETGYLQPTLKQLVEARGENISNYHMNPITAWKIREDGSVLFKPENYTR